MGVKKPDLPVSAIGDLVGEQAFADEPFGIADVQACGAVGLLDVEVFRLAVACHRHHIELHLALTPAAILEDDGKVAVDAAPDLAAFAEHGDGLGHLHAAIL
jgi:hypothetical protein